MAPSGSTAEPSDTRRPRRSAVVLLWLLVAVAFTLVQVRQSLYFGRLAAPPTYDDIAYLEDAQTRLHTFYTAGLGSAVREAFQDPPHSPWSTGLAGLAFMVFGMREWAPAAANGLVILGLLLALSWHARDLPLRWQLLIAVFLLTWPFSGQLVVNCRPDLACGLVTAWTGLYVVTRPWLEASRRRHYLAGAGLGLALLIKPTVSPLTLAVVLTALGAATLTDLTGGRWRRRWWPALGAGARCLGLGLLIAGPFYIADHRGIYDYLYRHNLGELKELWRVDLTAAEQALYYLTGTGGRFLLDVWLFLWLGLAAATLGLLLARRDVAALRRLPAVTAVFLVTWALISIPAHKNQFLGAALPALLLLSAMLMMVHLARESRLGTRGWTRLAGTSVIALSAIAGVALFNWPAHYAPWQPLPTGLARQHRELLDEVHQAIQRFGKSPVRVLFTQIGPYLNPPLLRFQAGLERLPKPDALDLAMDTDPAALETQLSAATHVVVYSADNPSSIRWLPAAATQQQVLDRLGEHPRFVLEGRYATPGGGQLFLFEEALEFGGLDALEGLGPIEGPYPELGLEFPVRWGLGPRTLLEIESPPGGRARLFLDGAASLADQVMTVWLGDRLVGEHRFTGPNEFERIALTLDLPPGRHVVEIRYARWQPPSEREARPLAVLFRTLLAVDASSAR